MVYGELKSGAVVPRGDAISGGGLGTIGTMSAIGT
jgi:hypothetical protein